VCTHVTSAHTHTHSHTHAHTPILILLNQIHSAIDWTHIHYPDLIRQPPHTETIQPRYSIHISSAVTEGWSRPVEESNCCGDKQVPSPLGFAYHGVETTSMGQVFELHIQGMKLVDIFLLQYQQVNHELCH